MALDLAAQLLQQYGLNAFNQGSNLFNTAYVEGGRRFDDILRRINQQSQYARQEAFQREENKKARKSQEKQADKARKDSWTRFGIGAGTAAAGGALALAPTMSAVPAVTGAGMAGAETVGNTGVMAAQAPNLTNAANATALANPEAVAMMPGTGEAVQSAVSSTPSVVQAPSMAGRLNPSGFNPATYNAATMPLSPVAAPGTTAMVSPASFQTGTPLTRGLRGAALGTLGFMSGQNLLGPEMAAPFQQYAAYRGMANDVADRSMEAAKLAETSRHNKAVEANFGERTDKMYDPNRPRGGSALVDRMLSLANDPSASDFDRAFATDFLNKTRKGGKPFGLRVNEDPINPGGFIIGSSINDPTSIPQAVSAMKQARGAVEGKGESGKSFTPSANYFDVAKHMRDAKTPEDAKEWLKYAYEKEKRLTDEEYRDLFGTLP